jgi:hypothetical protein
MSATASRSPGYSGGMWAAGTATAFVAATAFVLAYGGSKGAALDAGISAQAAGWYPLCIEGVIVVASLATVVLPRGERVLGWAVLLGFTGLSAAANVLHALDHAGHRWWSPGFAVVPPLALPLCVRLAERVALSTGRRTPDERTAGPDWTPDVVPTGRPDDRTLDIPSTPPEPSTPDPVDTVRPDGQLDVRPDAEPDVRPDAEPDAEPDIQPPVRRTPRRTSGRKPAGRRTGRPAGRSTGHQTGHSTGRPAPDWRLVADARGVSRSRAYDIIRDDPAAVSEARAALNGAAP